MVRCSISVNFAMMFLVETFSFSHKRKSESYIKSNINITSYRAFNEYIVSHTLLRAVERFSCVCENNDGARWD